MAWQPGARIFAAGKIRIVTAFVEQQANALRTGKPLGHVRGPARRIFTTLPEDAGAEQGGALAKSVGFKCLLAGAGHQNSAAKKTSSL